LEIGTEVSDVVQMSLAFQNINFGGIKERENGKIWIEILLAHLESGSLDLTLLKIHP
jgi:hypothetical protein